jgi:hypothetical protein
MGKPGQARRWPVPNGSITKGINRLAHIPLAGVNGADQVEGKDWNLNMAAMGAALPDEDLAGRADLHPHFLGQQAGKSPPRKSKKFGPNWAAARSP